MRHVSYVQLATQGIAPVLLFGVVCAANAEQMMRALPALAAAQPVVALPAVQQIAVPAASPTAVATPAAISPVAKPPSPNIPMNQTGLPAGSKSQMKLAPPSQGGGVAQLNPAAACGMNPTPRISNINGTQSGVVFKPGDSLNIAGCGFGKSGRAQLGGGGATVQLKVDSWEDSNIHAHIDAALGGVLDFGGAKLTIYPNGAPVLISQVAHSFRAVRETMKIPLPPELGIYSQVYAIYGALERVSDGQYTRVDRDFTYTPFCPDVTAQSQLVDVWPIDSSFFAKGFEVLDVFYVNRTIQNKTDNDEVQEFLVGGNSGGAIYDNTNRKVTVTFQAHSAYKKKHLLPGIPLREIGGSSRCTSSYMVSLTVNGPRGVAPFK